jgi:hypothetical protein
MVDLSQGFIQAIGLYLRCVSYNREEFAMVTKMTIALVTAFIFGAGSVAMAANDEQSTGGYRTFGPGGAATSGINAVHHAQAASACAKKYKSYNPSDMTYLGKDGKRHPCE